MKKLTVSFISIIVLLQAFTHNIIVGIFRSNQDYIAQVLCVNKAKPALKCGGRCQLMKKMAAEQDEQTSKTLTLKISLLPFIDINSHENIACIQLDKIVHYFFYLADITKGEPVAVFHPPLNG